MRWNLQHRLVAIAIAAFPLLAHAEVRDKVTPPWGAALMIGTVGFTTGCALLLCLRRAIPAFIAAALAGVWLAVRFDDPLYEFDLGPAIRREFSPTAVAVWEWLIPIQAFLPLATILSMAVPRLIRGGAKQ